MESSALGPGAGRWRFAVDREGVGAAGGEGGGGVRSCPGVKDGAHGAKRSGREPVAGLPSAS